MVGTVVNDDISMVVYRQFVHRLSVYLAGGCTLYIFLTSRGANTTTNPTK